MPTKPQRHQPPGHQTKSEWNASRDAQGFRSWYKTARWQKLRWSILVRDQFTCKACGKLEGKTSLLHCDHVEPHRGDSLKFWSGPFQTLCAHCHNADKQRLEATQDGGGD